MFYYFQTFKFITFSLKIHKIFIFIVILNSLLLNLLFLNNLLLSNREFTIIVSFKLFIFQFKIFVDLFLALMEQRRIDSFDPLTMLMSMNDDAQWKEQVCFSLKVIFNSNNFKVSAGLIYLMSVIDELKEENADLRRQIGAQPRASQSDADDKVCVLKVLLK